MNTNARLLLGALFLSIFPFVGDAHATQFVMNFSVRDFVDTQTHTPAPTDPVTGTFVYNAAGIHDPIQSLISVNLVIDGHAYTPAGIGYSAYDPNDPAGIMFYGLPGEGLGGGLPNDFWIRWGANSLLPFDFEYTSSSGRLYESGVYYNPNCFTTFTITQVPEPAVPALLALCAAILVIRRTMKKILLLAAAAFCCTQITHADVIYRETFRTMTNNATLNLVGWEGFVGPTATGNPLGSQLGISSLVGKPPLLTNINAGPSVGFPSNGFVRVTGGAPGSSNWVVFTSEYTVDTSLWDISTISFYGGSNTNPLGQMPGFRIAVQVGGNWFASDQLLTQTSAVTSDGAFSSPTFGAQLLTFNWTEAANAWRQLNFVPGSALSLSGSTLGADLPGGNITAFGLYSDPVFGAPARRFDTYEINANAIPEPTALTLALIAGAALLIRRRMV